MFPRTQVRAPNPYRDSIHTIRESFCEAQENGVPLAGPYQRKRRDTIKVLIHAISSRCGSKKAHRKAPKEKRARKAEAGQTEVRTVSLTTNSNPFMNSSKISLSSAASSNSRSTARTVATQTSTYSFGSTSPIAFSHSPLTSTSIAFDIDTYYCPTTYRTPFSSYRR